MNKGYSRRHFVRTAVTSAIALPFVPAVASASVAPVQHLTSERSKRKIHIFSKHLQWLDYDAMASFVADCGFDGTDVTVRPGGHVEPDRVETDLPLVVSAMKKVGREVTLITTSILRAEEPHTESILKTAGQLGIGYYRMGWHNYDARLSVEENLRAIERDFRALIVLNQKYNIKGAYQNHAGAGFGSPVWDVAKVLHTINSPWVGCQYDVRHATVEGANSWVLGWEYIKPHINSLDVKDFRWVSENGKSKAENVPLGQGVVDFGEYFKRISSIPNNVPICLHMEYPLGGAEHGNRTITIKPEVVKRAMVADLTFVRERT
jgi:L-ribulose-5-phosphate 3-epimerase